MVIGGILFRIRNLLERCFRISVHVHRHIYRIVTDLYFLCISGIGAAVGAGAASFLALVDCAVLPLMRLEQLPANRAGDGFVLMPDKADDHVALLELYRDRRILVALRQYARMQALLDILRIVGTTGFFVDFGWDVFEVEDAFVLVILEAHVGNRAVHHALLDRLYWALGESRLFRRIDQLALTKKMQAKIPHFGAGFLR